MNVVYDYKKLRYATKQIKYNNSVIEQRIERKKLALLPLYIINKGLI